MDFMKCLETQILLLVLSQIYSQSEKLKCLETPNLTHFVKSKLCQK